MSNYPKVNYIGNKEKLAEWIMEEMPVKEGVVLDLFAGGCSVSYRLKECGYSVLSNDILYADYVLARGLIENTDNRLALSVFEKSAEQACIDKWMQKIHFLKNRLYYEAEIEELAKLLSISEQLEGGEKYLYLSLLRRAMIRKLPYSRMNVPWDQIQKLRDEDYSYEKYKRRRAYHNQTFESHMRENIDAYNNAVFKGRPCKAFHCDAMEMVNRIDKVDVVYMDPPYPSTMNNYDAFYGLFDEMFGMKQQHTDFTKRTTFIQNMEEIIKSLCGKTGYIVLSQNTRVQPGPNEMEEMLSGYGEVIVKEKPHNYQVTGKENKNSSKELLFMLDLNS